MTYLDVLYGELPDLSLVTNHDILLGELPELFLVTYLDDLLGELPELSLVTHLDVLYGELPDFLPLDAGRAADPAAEASTPQHNQNYLNRKVRACLYYEALLEVLLPYLSVRRLIGRSVCHNFLKGQGSYTSMLQSEHLKGASVQLLPLWRVRA